MRTGTKTVPSTWCIFNVTGHLFTFLVVLSLICLVTTQILIFGNKTILLLEQHPMSDHAHPAHPPSHKHTHTHAHAHTRTHTHTHTHAHTHTHTNKKDTICLMTSPHPTFSPHISIFSTLFSGISKGADKENLWTDQKLLSLVIISFILMTLMCDIVGRNLMLVTLRI